MLMTFFFCCVIAESCKKSTGSLIEFESECGVVDQCGTW